MRSSCPRSPLRVRLWVRPTSPRSGCGQGSPDIPAIRVRRLTLDSRHGMIRPVGGFRLPVCAEVAVRCPAASLGARRRRAIPCCESRVSLRTWIAGMSGEPWPHPDRGDVGRTHGRTRIAGMSGEPWPHPDRGDVGRTHSRALCERSVPLEPAHLPTNSRRSSMLPACRLRDSWVGRLSKADEARAVVRRHPSTARARPAAKSRTAHAWHACCSW